ncbi:putative mitochondrial protein [Cucumis melo var. makuwa]|uniref:Putative mitochondrial protein n=1 Tax=Cucumis melo var. makuwa TaxID=1194695 RepID=A0A5D3CX03_CUCMM|nr:putative mitochondrial protein [Cucumis melo var. makuwa]
MDPPSDSAAQPAQHQRPAARGPSHRSRATIEHLQKPTNFLPSVIPIGESSTQSKSTNLPMYSKNSITSLLNLSSIYIIAFLAPSIGIFPGEKLNDQNYFSWSQSIKMFLEDCHQFGFLTEETVRPPPATAKDPWDNLFEASERFSVVYAKKTSPESASEESNCTLEFIEPTPSILFDSYPQLIVLPTNQVSWKTYYRRNLRKEIKSSTDQSASVQDSKLYRDQGRMNPIELCVDSKMSENDSFDVVVPKNDHLGNLDEYDPSLDIRKNVFMEVTRALDKNKTWEIYALPKGHRICECCEPVHTWQLAPYKEHMEAVNRILRYLKMTSGKGLMFKKADRKLLRSILILTGQGAVLRPSIRLRVWGYMRKFGSRKLSDLHQNCEISMKLLCDNKVAICIANNPIQPDRNKHVEIDRCFIKERLDNGSICIPYISLSQQVADVLS